MKPRPHPDELLKQVQEAERKAMGGKLKIYLGAAPGVGKTYAMLVDALGKRTRGLDVVVGILESHGRKEVEEMLSKLEIVPRKTVNYHGKEIQEFDLDTALKRNPALILVDEMAHTNVPPARHKKRWQDIKELLDRGLDVYTTLNVQHLESLNDVIAKILHIKVQETVPDKAVDLADTIELVDLPPEDLLRRLDEGKVYFPSQALIAKDHFFKKGNLIALRELALRAAVERVNTDALLYKSGEKIKKVWSIKDKILVCVGAHSDAIKLIRAARRLATSLKAEWLAVHVRSPKSDLSDQVNTEVISNLQFAENLGAETRILTGLNIAEELINFAEEQNVTQILIKKHIKSRWKEFFYRSLTDEIIRKNQTIDICVIAEEASNLKMNKEPSPKERIPWLTYGLALVMVSLMTLINLSLQPLLSPTTIMMLYLLVVIGVSLWGQLGPSIITALISFGLLNMVFISTFETLELSDVQIVIPFVALLGIAYIISYLIFLIRRLTRHTRISEHHAASLIALSRRLSTTRGSHRLLRTAVLYLADLFNCDVMAILPRQDNKISGKAAHHNELKIYEKSNAKQILTEKEMAVCHWVFDLGQKAGLGTETLSSAQALYVPLLASQEIIGVLRLCPIQTRYLFSPDQIRLLESSANQIALALEVDRLEELSRIRDLNSKLDHVRTTLLQSVSQDLQAPLSEVMNTTLELIQMTEILNHQQLTVLVQNSYSDLIHIQHLVRNLLHITYLSNESLSLRKDYFDIKDVINYAIQTLSKKIEHRSIELYISEAIPKLLLDINLIREVFVNLIDNAIKFTPINSVIQIHGVIEKDNVLFSIEDQGPGIHLSELDKLFDKFYRGSKAVKDHGLGLGLAICLNIIEAHQGSLWVENRKQGGAAFKFTLPL